MVERHSPPLSVTVTRKGEEWLVVVTEGLSVAERSFGFAQAANSFAYGQRVRLGLAMPLIAEPQDAHPPGLDG